MDIDEIDMEQLNNAIVEVGRNLNPGQTSFRWKSNKLRALEAIRAAKLAKLGGTGAKIKTPPSYESNRRIINFAGKEIKVPENTHQETLCKIIFRKPLKSWDMDEIFDKWGSELVGIKLPWKTIYNAAYDINLRIAAETGLKRLIVCTSKTCQIDPKYQGKNNQNLSR